MNVLDRYIGRTIFVTIMLTLFILVSLSGTIKFIEQLKKTGEGGYNTVGAGVYTLFSVPKDIQIFFPMAVLLGTLLGLGTLTQHNELIVIQALGYTRIQIVISVMKTAIPLVLLTMIMGELVVPWGEKIARNYRAQSMYGGSLFSTQQHGLWAKDGQNFIYIERVQRNDKLNGVHIFSFDESRNLQSVRYAIVGKFDSKEKIWHLTQVYESNLQNRKQIISSKNSSSIWRTNLTPDKLSVVVLDPDALSISGLYDYVVYLKLSDQDATRYQLNMWKKIFQPFSILVMMLMALSFIFGPLRTGPIGVRVLTGVSFGFIFYILDQIFSQLTLVYSMPPVISVLIPSIIFFFIGIWLLLKKF